MFKKLTLAAAAGAGYVLGAKAGKERYTQIEAKFREIAGMPAVQNATATVKETASDVAESAKATVSEKASSVTGAKGSPGSGTSGGSDVVVDLGTSTSATAPMTSTTPTTPITPPRTTITPATGPGSTMTGASSSPTAPDLTRP